MKTPLLFLIFNRPDTTQRVFEEIRKARPEKLFVAADGPRAGRPDDVERCRQAREIVAGARIDWPCQVETLFRDTNLGCKAAVSSAINWFFGRIEEGIILEDDCLPDQSFFPFCEDMLERYRSDARVMMVSGDNFQDGRTWGDGSYYFSRVAHIWGWATWKRAWQAYDVEMRSFPAFKAAGRIGSVIPDERLAAYVMSGFERAHDGKVDTWDAQWAYALYERQGLSIAPNVNLVSNIGFGPEATHTTGAGRHNAMKTGSIGAIIHPTGMQAQEQADRYELIRATSKPSFAARIIGKLYRAFRSSRAR